MPAPVVTDLPDPPLRTEDSATFSTKAEAFVAALVGFVPEINALGAYLQALESGTLSALLAAIDGAGSAANKLPYYTGSNAVALADLTSVARTLLAQTTQALMRTTGLGMSSNGSSLVSAADYAAMKVLLALTVGTDVQAYSAKLTSIAANTVTTQSGTSYTAVLADADTYIQFTNGSAISFTIPPNSSVAFSVGTVIEVEQAGAGALSFVAGSGVTLNSRSSDLTLAGQYAVAFAKKVATNTWTVNGDL
jgi:hypothetical protein